ncbi:hypothetical protein ACFLRF_01220 [Candidatus Altiarchaeota archaeon]
MASARRINETPKFSETILIDMPVLFKSDPISQERVIPALDFVRKDKGEAGYRDIVPPEYQDAVGKISARDYPEYSRQRDEQTFLEHSSLNWLVKKRLHSEILGDHGFQKEGRLGANEEKTAYMYLANGSVLAVSKPDDSGNRGGFVIKDKAGKVEVIPVKPFKMTKDLVVGEAVGSKDDKFRFVVDIMASGNAVLGDKKPSEELAKAFSMAWTQSMKHYAIHERDDMRFSVGGVCVNVKAWGDNYSIMDPITPRLLPGHMKAMPSQPVKEQILTQAKLFMDSAVRDISRDGSVDWLAGIPLNEWEAAANTEVREVLTTNINEHAEPARRKGLIEKHASMGIRRFMNEEPETEIFKPTGNTSDPTPKDQIKGFGLEMYASIRRRTRLHLGLPVDYLSDQMMNNALEAWMKD